jgi:hypothetical protein
VKRVRTKAIIIFLGIHPPPKNWITMDKIVMTKSWRNMQVPYPTARLLPFLPPFFTLLYPGALIPMLLIIGEFL